MQHCLFLQIWAKKTTKNPNGSVISKKTIFDPTLAEFGDIKVSCNHSYLDNTTWSWAAVTWRTPPEINFENDFFFFLNYYCFCFCFCKLSECTIRLTLVHFSFSLQTGDGVVDSWIMTVTRLIFCGKISWQFK